MVNKNVFDKFCEAVEDYNTTITDPKKKSQTDKYSYAEKKGIFYNCLRRVFSLGNCYKSPYIPRLRMQDFDIILDEDGRITSWLIHRNYQQNEWLYDSDEEGLIGLQIISKEHPIIYPTTALNELARIVNQLKINTHV